MQNEVTGSSRGNDAATNQTPVLPVQINQNKPASVTHPQDAIQAWADFATQSGVADSKVAPRRPPQLSSIIPSSVISDARSKKSDTLPPHLALVRPDQLKGRPASPVLTPRQEISHPPAAQDMPHTSPTRLTTSLQWDIKKGEDTHLESSEVGRSVLNLSGSLTFDDSKSSSNIIDAPKEIVRANQGRDPNIELNWGDTGLPAPLECERWLDTSYIPSYICEWARNVPDWSQDKSFHMSAEGFRFGTSVVGKDGTLIDHPEEPHTIPGKLIVKAAKISLRYSTNHFQIRNIPKMK